MYNINIYENKPDAYFQYERAEMLPYIPLESKAILEIGCGNGAFAKIVKEKISCDYWGVEPDKRFEDQAKKNLDHFINSLFDDQINLPKGYFDVIVFNDVLEHLLYPEDTLLLCKRYLKKNSLIVSSIPNIRYAPYFYSLFYLAEFEYYDEGIMDRTHFRFFTQKSIKKMYERCGYVVMKNEGINKKFLPSKYKIPLFLLNLFTFGKYSDLYFLQMSTVAKLR